MDRFKRSFSRAMSSGPSSLDEEAKACLTAAIKQSIKRFLSRHSSADVVDISRHDELALEVCQAVEDLFTHELKQGGTSSPGQVEEMYAALWTVMKTLSHSDEIRIIEDMPLFSEQSRCKAWLRRSMNQRTLGSYFQALVGHPDLLADHYTAGAFLRDPGMEKVEIVAGLLKSLDAFEFNLSIGDLCAAPSESQQAPQDQAATNTPSATDSATSGGAESDARDWSDVAAVATCPIEVAVKPPVRKLKAKKKKRSHHRVRSISGSEGLPQAPDAILEEDADAVGESLSGDGLSGHSLVASESEGGIGSVSSFTDMEAHAAHHHDHQHDHGDTLHLRNDVFAPPSADPAGSASNAVQNSVEQLQVTTDPTATAQTPTRPSRSAPFDPMAAPDDAGIPMSPPAGSGALDWAILALQQNQEDLIASNDKEASGHGEQQGGEREKQRGKLQEQQHESAPQQTLENAPHRKEPMQDRETESQQEIGTSAATTVDVAKSIAAERDRSGAVSQEVQHAEQQLISAQAVVTEQASALSTSSDQAEDAEAGYESLLSRYLAGPTPQSPSLERVRACRIATEPSAAAVKLFSDEPDAPSDFESHDVKEDGVAGIAKLEPEPVEVVEVGEQEAPEVEQTAEDGQAEAESAEAILQEDQGSKGDTAGNRDPNSDTPGASRLPGPQPVSDEANDGESTNELEEQPPAAASAAVGRGADSPSSPVSAAVLGALQDSEASVELRPPSPQGSFGFRQTITSLASRLATMGVSVYTSVAGRQDTGFTMVDSHSDGDSEVLDYDEQTTLMLLSGVHVLCPEKGLDTQEFKCAACQAAIGMIFGEAKLCDFSGKYFCSTCHADDEAVIPARVLHNWDFHPRRVSKQVARFLRFIEGQPLFNIEAATPILFTLVEELKDARRTRALLLVGFEYVSVCPKADKQQFRKHLWPREHLWTSAQLYSLEDLRLVRSGHLQATLHKVLHLLSDHVRTCEHCRHKGHVCEIRDCKDSSVLFPFDLDRAHQCQVCKAVFHKTCFADAGGCPKCKRLGLKAEHTAAEA